MASCLLAVAGSFGACDRNSNSVASEEVRAAATTMGDRPSLEQVCRLVTPAEVEAVLGREVGQPREPEPLHIAVGMRACAYGEPGEEVTVGLSSSFAPQVFDKAVAKLKANNVALVPLHNIGDEAVAFFGGWLLVRVNPYVLYLGIKRTNPPFLPTEAAPPAIREQNINLALKALDRLPKQRSRI